LNIGDWYRVFSPPSSFRRKPESIVGTVTGDRCGRTVRLTAISSHAPSAPLSICHSRAER
jgi:hypothetical protein